MGLAATGPQLIELGARLCGGKAPELVSLCTGYGQHEALADAYCDAGSFLQRNPEHSPSRFCMNVHLICPEEGRVLSGKGLEKLGGLAAFHRVDTHSPAGTRLAKTIDLLTSPGTVRFIGSSLDELRKCVEQVRGIESDCLYGEYSQSM
jgi:hypothetical protein